MESLVKEMEKSKKHSATISMGDVTGVIQIQADNSETEDLCYSSDQNAVNVRRSIKVIETHPSFINANSSFHRFLTVKVVWRQVFPGLQWFPVRPLIKHFYKTIAVHLLKLFGSKTWEVRYCILYCCFLFFILKWS